jgi:hypothetical protein
MDNYKQTQTRLAKAKDDLAISGNTAVVMDAENNNQLAVVSVADIVTSRTKTGGSVRARFTPVTVGKALSLRFENPEFSGFTDKGAAIDNILNNVVDSSLVDSEMDTLFKKAGTISVAENKFYTSAGEPKSLEGLLKDLSEATKSYAQQTVKNSSNASALATAVDVFRRNLSPGHLEALRNKAISKFNENYGSTADINEAKAAEWIDSTVNSYIAERASIFLREAAAKSGGVKAAPGSKTPEKRMVDMNQVTLQSLAPSEVVQLEADYGDADDLKSNLASVKASSIGIDETIADEAAKNKGKAVTLGQSSFIKKIAGNLTTNLFLGDTKSTPITSLNGGNGLEQAVIDTSEGTQMKILQGVPYYEDSKGVKRIAWEKVNEALTWGKKYKELYLNECRVKGVKRLSPEDKKVVVEATVQATGIDLFATGKDLKIGNIAMIPIVINDKSSFDKGLENVFSSNITAKQAELGKTFTKFFANDDIKKTFAFAVMPTDFRSTLPNYYGDKLKIDKQINLNDVEANIASEQNNNYDILEVLADMIPADVTND